MVWEIWEIFYKHPIFTEFLLPITSLVLRIVHPKLHFCSFQISCEPFLKNTNQYKFFRNFGKIVRGTLTIFYFPMLNPIRISESWKSQKIFSSKFEWVDVLPVHFHIFSHKSGVAMPFDPRLYVLNLLTILRFSSNFFQP